jgi:hypothetical protein
LKSAISQISFNDSCNGEKWHSWIDFQFIVSKLGFYIKYQPPHWTGNSSLESDINQHRVTLRKKQPMLRNFWWRFLEDFIQTGFELWAIEWGLLWWSDFEKLWDVKSWSILWRLWSLKMTDSNAESLADPVCTPQCRGDLSLLGLEIGISARKLANLDGTFYESYRWNWPEIFDRMLTGTNRDFSQDWIDLKSNTGLWIPTEVLASITVPCFGNGQNCESLRKFRPVHFVLPTPTSNRIIIFSSNTHNSYSISILVMQYWIKNIDIVIQWRMICNSLELLSMTGITYQHAIWV